MKHKVFDKGCDSGELCSWVIKNIEIDSNFPAEGEDWDSSKHYTKIPKPYLITIYDSIELLSDVERLTKVNEELIEGLKEALRELRFHNWHNTTTGMKISALLIEKHSKK
jgi:hypothetical protein